MRYIIDEKSTLTITEEAIVQINMYRQLPGKNESGGVLLGKIRKDLSEYIITDISNPTRFDRSGPCFFIRSRKSVQPIIDKLWNESKGEIIYLGEWHSHAEKNPGPSSIDNALLKKSFRENKVFGNILFMIIIGTTGEMYVGCYKKGDKKMYRLERMRVDDPEKEL
ncbi:Mov34/MPN/PAD-1 family protein [Tissierella carlieri]|uniref:Mov34/MPN/PAD-1 family protein n=1 Tax=Tissierella carlieri TaxID=689904 RepID=A0ABT1SEP9_9FIRM|nr:Mov34/MPN/PAD-1 family protein [Tissierella carlieri]MCQ4924954.1 Mov34/MPN/PAD-1 family protein [Tissierella carlieri]